MHRLLLLILVLCTAGTGSGHGVQGEFKVGENVKDATSASFRSLLSSTTSLLVLFHAEYCGACAPLRSAMNDAARNMALYGVPGVMAGVDCHSEPALCREWGVGSPPALIHFADGGKRYVKYRGQTTAAALQRFMRDPRPPPPPPPESVWSEEDNEVLHLTAETFDEAVEKEDTLVMFYAPWCGHCKAMKSAYAEAAKISPATFVAVDATIERQLATRFDVKGYPTLLHFRPGSAEPIKYTGERTAAALATFWTAHDEL